MRSLFKAILFIAAFVTISDLCKKETHGFSILGISSQRPHNPAWETRALTHVEKNTLNQALAQKYLYADCGGQSFVFFSEDGKYALKLFKQKLFHSPLWIKYFPIPLSFVKADALKRAEKLQRDFVSYKMAFDALQEETKILFVHLNKTEELPSSLTIRDPLGIEHRINPNAFDFVVQERAELFYAKINRLMKENKINEAKECIDATFNLIALLCEKGFNDRDPNLQINSGFVDITPIKIDVGKFLKEPSVNLAENIVRAGQPFQEWIKKNHPGLLPSVLETINRAKNE
jgi:hypothetical protein